MNLNNTTLQFTCTEYIKYFALQTLYVAGFFELNHIYISLLSHNYQHISYSTIIKMYIIIFTLVLLF